MQTTPLKIVQTKHSGQQSLRIRSDGKIFATAGWDSRVRVYSVQSLKELAVLKWHKEGCYAVAFAEIVITDSGGVGNGGLENTSKELERATAILATTALTVREKRDLRATTTHWLAAGSKDRKLSLWDIY
jgi:WD40 repeat protein